MHTRRPPRLYWHWLLLGLWLWPLVSLPPTARAAPPAPALQFAQALNTGGTFFTGGFLQDREGFFWIGTQSGLLKWDGVSLKRYTAGPKSISADYIYTILEDRAGRLWLATPNGLNQYDKRTDTFTVYKNDPADPNSLSHDVFNWVGQALAEDADGNIWAGTTGGLNKYDPRTNHFTRYLHAADDPHSLGSDNIFAVYVDPAGLVWIGTDAGLDRFDPAANTFTHSQNIPEQPTSLSSNSVTALLTDHAGVLWVGTLDGGLNRLDPATGTFTRYQHAAADPNSLANDYIYTITEVHPGELWLTSHIGLGGVDVFNTAAGTFQNYKHEANNPASLSFDQNLGVYRDRQGIIWISNYNGTLDKIDPAGRKFTLYRHNPNDAQSLGQELVLTAYQDRAGIMWLGMVGGLDKYDRKTGLFTHYQDFSIGAILGILEDSLGNFWLMDVFNLCRFDRAAGKCAQVYALECEAASTILEDQANPQVLWVATWRGGLARVDTATGQVRYYRHDPHNPASLSLDQFFMLFGDPQGFIWVPTYGGGLDQFDPRTEKVVVHYQNAPNDPTSLGSNTVNHAYVDSAGRVWVGTVGGGLNQLQADGTFKRYTTETGFPTNNVQNILEDKQGYLWLGSKIGLIRFDPRTETWKLYTVEDGLQGNESQEYPFFRADDGEIWVYGANGANSFYPDQIKDNPYRPPVYFTALTQGGEPLPGVQAAPERVTAITLDWQHNYFEFEAAALNFTQPEKNQYQYRLEGFDKDWYNAGTQPNGRYSGLPAGVYTLRVRGANNDGVWSDQEAVLTVTVVGPFWSAPWFGVLLAALGLGSVGGGIVWRFRAIQAQKRALEEIVDRRTHEIKEAQAAAETAAALAAAASSAKTVFLANMSHELRTPLNVILGFTQLMARRPGLAETLRQQLTIINRSGEHLLTMINDILDLAKIEAGRFELNLEAFDLHQLLREVGEMMRSRAQAKDLAFLLEPAPDLLPYIYADQGKLRQVLINLLGNAVKFTEQGGVALRAYSQAPAAAEDQHWLELEIEDTGLGIPPDKLETIFEPFEQAGPSPARQKGTGLGLAISRSFTRLMGGGITVESALGKGTIFWVKVPIRPAAPEDVPAAPPPPPAVLGLEPGQPVWRILIVEDDEENRQLLEMLLTEAGFTWREASNGQEAVAITQAWQPHLIWMDMRMPVMDGYEATRRIRALPEGQSFKILALTASAFRDEEAQIRALGCDDVLHKPYQPHQIFSALAQHLGVRYIYAASEVATAEPQPAAEAAHSAADLAAWPAALRLRLHQAALALDKQQVLAVAAEIEAAQPALAAFLRAQAAAYHYPAILALTAEQVPAP